MVGRSLVILAAFFAGPSLAGAEQAGAEQAGAELSPLEDLGKALFFDQGLSVNENQSCASCHDPDQGFSSPHGHFNAEGAVVMGSVAGRFGNRKPPSAAYASASPALHHTFRDGDILFAGGAFFDGRATGHQLGLPLADQALGPFVNPVEMALPHAVCVVQRACAASYADAMKNIWGPEICALPVRADLTEDCRNPDAKITIEDKDLEERINSAYRAIALSVAAYEGSAEVNRFAAPIDRYLAGKAPLGAAAERGLALFTGKAGCSDCHSLAIGPEGGGPFLTDFTYSNLGVPKNPANPWYEQQKFNPEGAEWIDRGLAGTLGKDPVYVAYAAENMGAQKVPTLRNLTKRITPDTERAYMHNGYFKTLEGLVHFLNSRDRLPRCQEALTEAEALAAACWPAPEVEATMTRQIGDLGLSPEEEAELVAFLRTLDDD